MATTNLPPFRVTKLQRSSEGFWQANVSVNGHTVQVDRRYGSWQIVLTVNGNSVRRDMVALLAAALQAKVRPLEKAEIKVLEAQS